MEIEIKGLKRILAAGASFEMKTDLHELVFIVQWASYRAEHRANRNDDVIDLLDIATEVEFRNTGYPDDYMDEEDEDYDGEDSWGFPEPVDEEE